MTSYLLRRIGQAIAVLIGVILIMFILTHLLPGGPARAVLGAKATPEAVAGFNAAHGLDQPLWRQFIDFFVQLLQGNLGHSYARNQAVTEMVIQYLPRSAMLLFIAYTLALAIGIPLGIFQAVRRNRPSDYTLTGLSFIFYSMPSFLVGFLLIAIFAIRFKVFPPAAPAAGSVWAILAQPRGLVLPVVTIAVISIASYSRYMRSSALENLALDYIRTARAKGANTRLVISRHLLRNAMLPIVTMVGLSLPNVIAGALVTEQVFNYPGMGLMFLKAAYVQDYPVMMGFAVCVGTATVVGSLLADIAYGVLDPRVRLAVKPT